VLSCMVQIQLWDSVAFGLIGEPRVAVVTMASERLRPYKIVSITYQTYGKSLWSLQCPTASVGRSQRLSIYFLIVL